MNPFVTGLCKGVLRSPLKGGSRTFAIPANGGHRRDHHHNTQLSSFLVRTEGRLKFVGANLFPAKNPVDACREVVPPQTLDFQLSNGTGVWGSRTESSILTK